MKQVTIHIASVTFPTNPGRAGGGIVASTTDALGFPYSKALGVYLGEPHTNNAAELMTAIFALEMLNQSCAVTLISSSQYLIKTMTDGWQRGKNTALWEQLDDAAMRHSITWQWVKSNSGDECNDQAFYYANEAAKTMEDVQDVA